MPSTAVTTSGATFRGAFFLLALAGLSCIGAVQAGDFPRVHLDGGVSILRFDYREYADSGGILDAERGLIAGFSGRFGSRHRQWEWEGAFDAHRGQVDYDGQTNLGVPYRTRTDETLYDVSLKLGRWLATPTPTMPYFAYGYRHWDRDILPGLVNGLFESYRWNYAAMGARFVLDNASTCDISLRKPLRPRMYMDFKGTYPESPVLHPQGRIGVRIALATPLHLSNFGRIELEPFYEYWSLGRSPTVSTGNLTLYEPASSSHHLGINFRYRWED